MPSYTGLTIAGQQSGDAAPAPSWRETGRRGQPVQAAQRGRSRARAQRVGQLCEHVLAARLGIEQSIGVVGPGRIVELGQRHEQAGNLQGKVELDRDVVGEHVEPTVNGDA